ncbi:hypothetical protein MMC25_005113 [Agyrium rufum]|nr:hypothetical protein [Agyrium rufum]
MPSFTTKQPEPPGLAPHFKNEPLEPQPHARVSMRSRKYFLTVASFSVCHKGVKSPSSDKFLDSPYSGMSERQRRRSYNEPDESSYTSIAGSDLKYSRRPREGMSTKEDDAYRYGSYQRRRVEDETTNSRSRKEARRSVSPSDRGYDMPRQARDHKSGRRHRDRSESPRRRAGRRYSSSHSPPPRRKHPASPRPLRSNAPLPSQNEAYSGKSPDLVIEKSGQLVEKQMPNYGQSGKLAAETNTVAGTGIVLKYNEPPESRKPPSSQAWKMYVFKGSDVIDTVDVYSRSCWLFGRERTVVDYPVDHPSCSKQHAVLQFRFVEKRNEYGDKIGKVKPYIIDLESANGTQVNQEAIPDKRYVELMSGDVVNFGDSTRDYVFILPPTG